MKLFYAIVLVLMVLVSACAQQAAEPKAEPAPVAEPTPAPEPTGPEISPEPETIAAVAVPEEEAAAPAAGNEVRVLGKAGFEPSELTTTAGSAVTWINDDQKPLTLTIFKNGKWYMNSNVIKPGERFEKEFSEAGSYEYWAIAYGVKAKITVE